MERERGPYVFRFKCNDCGSERDQRISRPEAHRIGCVCGGDAIKVGVDEVPVDEVRQGRYLNSKPHMQEKSYYYLKAQAEKRLQRLSPLRSLLQWLGIGAT